MHPRAEISHAGSSEAVELHAPKASVLAGGGKWCSSPIYHHVRLGICFFLPIIVKRANSR